MFDYLFFRRLVLDDDRTIYVHVFVIFSVFLCHKRRDALQDESRQSLKPFLRTETTLIQLNHQHILTLITFLP